MAAEVLVVGPHPALRELLAGALAESSAVANCRSAAPDDPLIDGDTALDWLVWHAAGHADGDQAISAAQPWLEPLISRTGCRLLVVASSAIHPPSHHHPGQVDEQFRGAARFDNPHAASWRRLEARALEAAGEDHTTVLRAAPVAVRGGQDWISRLFDQSMALVPMGFDPPIQVLAPADLAAAVCRVVESGRTKELRVLNVAPSAAIPLRRALRLAGVWRLPTMAWKLRWLTPAGWLDYSQYSWTVSGAKLAELGCEPQQSSADALRALKGVSTNTGEDDAFDPFGMDRGYISLLGRTLFRFLHDAWWRIEHRGLERVPRQGAAVLVGVHRGHQPWDAVMLLHLLARRLGRYPRFLIHPTLVKFPFLAPYIHKLGGIHASHDNADWALSRGHLIGVFPEGIRGAFCMYRDAYRLRRFGRHEYVKMALRHQVPIVPFVTIGSAEIFPIFGRIDWPWFKRFSEWPFLPITPTMGSVPLPSKWHTRFLEPIDVAAEHGPEAAEDPAVVRALGRQIKARMADALTELHGQRQSIFFGKLREQPEVAR